MSDTTEPESRSSDAERTDLPREPAEPAGDTPSPGTRGPRSGRLTGLVLLLTLAVVGADQLTKYVAEARLAPGGETQWFLGELLGWKLIYNPGAALSIGSGFTWLLTAVAVAVVIVVARTSRRIGSAWWALAFGLLLGGAVGNLIDRFFREPGFAVGHVVDFINYAGFFVGNVADIAIVVAAGLVAVLSFRGVPITGSAPDADGGAPEAGGSAGSAPDADRSAPDADAAGGDGGATGAPIEDASGPPDAETPGSAAPRSAG